MPVRVVTASATVIEVGASRTWYRPGLACSCACENAATVVCGCFPMSPLVGRMGTSWYEGQPVPLRWVRLKPLIRLSV